MKKNHSLISRNVTINGHRTSLRMENETWDALSEICLRENKTMHQLCTHVDEHRQVANRTSAIRAYIISYFRVAATEAGHKGAGHGKSL